MGKRRSSDAEAMRHWLETNGCPFDSLPDDPATLPLQIRQGAPAESTLFRIVPGLTGFCVWLQLATEVTRGVRVAEIDLRLEAITDMSFALLEPPEPAELPFYEFQGGFRVQRTQVLNHKIPGNIYPNQPWEGFLLGCSMQKLPAQFYRHIWAHLTVADDFRDVGAAQLHLVLEPQEHGRRKRNVERHMAQKILGTESES